MQGPGGVGDLPPTFENLDGVPPQLLLATCQVRSVKSSQVKSGPAKSGQLRVPSTFMWYKPMGMT